MGVGVLMSLLALPLLTSGGELQEGAVLLLLGLMIWSVVVMGHILRHTFDLTMGQGVALAALYSFASYQLTTTLFPVG